MALQSSFYPVDGRSRTYPQTKHVASKQHAAVYSRLIGTNTWVRLSDSAWNLINNAAVLDEAFSSSVYDQIEIRVADEADELTDSISDISTVASIATEIIAVEAIKTEIVSLESIKAAISSLYADKATLDSLYADKITLDSLFADKATLDSLFADKAKLDSLYTDKATLDSLFADKATLDSLYADKAKLDSLYADKATLDSIFADKAKLDSLFADKAKLDSLYADKLTLDSLYADKITLDSLYSNLTELLAIHTNLATILDAANQAAAAASSASSASGSATTAQLKAWEAEAEFLTAASYAVEPEDVFVKVYISDGDGTFTATPTTTYSALHWQSKTAAAGVPVPTFPADEGLALVARAAGNNWEKILGLPLETNNAHKTVTTDGVEGDSYWSPIVTSPNVIDTDFTMTVGANGSIVSPTINDGVTVTVPDGSTLVIL